ncbi:DUF4124 domain-containing protein [Psychromonas sp. MME2]|uniref:DUF4124 domain-containing protein n=1 Tax=unclassified Psychromonas TaxID=2614957 RepID=UPI00339C61D8
MRALLTLLTVSFFTTSAISAEIYTWTDKDGITHFSESKPAYQAEINEVTLLPISATISASEKTTAAPLAVKKEEVTRQNESKKQGEYQRPETATDKNILSERMVDQTDVSLKNDEENDALIDTIDRPLLRQAIVDGTTISINGAVKK